MQVVMDQDDVWKKKLSCPFRVWGHNNKENQRFYGGNDIETVLKKIQTPNF
jgi:hypothetical protein